MFGEKATYFFVNKGISQSLYLLNKNRINKYDTNQKSPFPPLLCQKHIEKSPFTCVLIKKTLRDKHGNLQAQLSLQNDRQMKIPILLLWLGFTYASPSPHIVFILADDLGVNDVGWRNPRILTPNLGVKRLIEKSEDLFCRFLGWKWSGFGTALRTIPMHTLACCPHD